jgi:hypothetical protein
MKSFIRTIMVLAVFGLAMGGFAPAQDPLDEAPEEGVTEPSKLSVSSPRSEPRPSRVIVPPPSIESIDTVVASGIESAGPWAAPPPGEGYSLSRVALGRGGDRKVLIIPTEDVKVEDLTAIWQDLYVMSRIFDRKFSKGSRLVREVFPDYGDFFRQDSRATEAIYLQGYGALFLMEANFPLTAPPKSKEEEAKKTEEPSDPTWQRAKQELFSPRIPTGWRPPREKYDAEQIEELKRELIKSLKHAANIRNLKSDEWVILTVTGAGRKSNEYISTYFKSPTDSASSASRYSGGGYSYSGGGGYSETGPSSAMVHTIRAKKSDVDAFAKGDLGYDKFREKVQIFSYPYLGQNLGGARRTTRSRSRTRVPQTRARADEPTKPEPPGR